MVAPQHPVQSSVVDVEHLNPDSFVIVHPLFPNHPELNLATHSNIGYSMINQQGVDMSDSRVDRAAPRSAAGWTDRAAWGLQVALFVLFVAAGVTKILGTDTQVESFAKIGAGQWLRYVVGILETSLAVLLLVPRLAGIASLALTVSMVGAVYAELFLKEENSAFAIVTLVAVGVMAWRRRGTLSWRE